MGEISYLNETGDTKVIWDPSNLDEVANAREVFDRLRRKNFIAYEVERKGVKGKVLQDFDPDAGKIILIPMLQGG